MGDVWGLEDRKEEEKEEEEEEEEKEEDIAKHLGGGELHLTQRRPTSG